MKVVGIVVDVEGKYFVKDKDGNIRRLKIGDKIYEGEEVYGSSNHDKIVIESPLSNEKITLLGFDEYIAGEFGHTPQTTPSLETQESSESDEASKPTTTTKSSDSAYTTPSQNEAIGFQEVFLNRDGEIINVEASLLDTRNKSTQKDNETNNDTLAFNPAPILTTNSSEVQDNFYDTHLASGTNTAKSSFTYEALSGFKTLTIGTREFTLSQLEALNITPVDISMQAGVLTLDGYTKVDNENIISYTYKTNSTYTHDIDSDIFADTLAILIRDIGGKEASSSIVINVIDDMPEAQDDSNSLQEGETLNYVSGNVLQDINHDNAFGSFGDSVDYMGADDSNMAIPVVAIDGGVIGTAFTTLYGELLLKADGSYKYILDNTNQDVRVLVDGETLNEIFTYTIEDADGDKSTATLTIEIEGNSSTPLLFVSDGSVEESAIDVIGTNPSSNSEIITGNIVGTANDGFDKIVFTTSMGVVLEITNLAAINGTQTIDTPQGTLTLLTYLESSYIGNSAVKIGLITYSYELNTPYDNALVSDSFEDIISITITDIYSKSGSDDLNITIADDKPLAVDDVNVITEDSALITEVSGNVLTNDNDGADTNATPITPQNIAGLYGQFVLNSDGTYTYTLDNDNPIVNALNAGDTLNDTLNYTITDSDGDSTTANLDITINGFTDPNLSVADVTVVEDGESTGNLEVTFTVSMDTTSLRDVTFHFTTLDGTALDGKEYTHLNGVATILAGQTTTTVTVTLGADDYVSDSDKIFDLKISNVNTAGFILDDRATATIEDDSKANTPYDSSDTIEDSLESVTLKLISVDSLGNPTASTIQEGDKAFYKVIVVDANDNPVLDKDGNLAQGSVNVLVSDGTAHSNNSITGIGDFDGTSPLVVDVNTVFAVQTIDDAISDSGETFSVAIANDTSYSNAGDYENIIHDTSPLVTTINDGTSTLTTLSLSGDTTVVESAIANYTLTLSHKSEVAVAVEVTISHITTNDLDVIATTKAVMILAGQLSADFTVDTLDDTVYEGNENFNVSIVAHTDGEFESLSVTQDRVTTTITDNETPPELSVSDITILEDGTATFTVTMSGEAKDDVTFNFDTSDGTALAGKDYVAVMSGNATIAAGSLSTTVSVILSDDYIADNGETFNVTLSNASSNATITTSSATATIEDNSQANTPFDSTDAIENSLESVNIKLIAYDHSGNIVSANEAQEGAKAFYKVILVEDDGVTPILDASGNPASGNVDITYTDGTASGAIDFSNTLTSVEVNKIFSVDILNDVLNDPDETFEVSVVNDSYSNASEYENVVTDTSTITTTIKETAIPTVVFVRVIDDATTDEVDGALLTHRLEFYELDGTLVNLTLGAQVTVDLAYSLDTTSAADFQTKLTQVVITGDGTSSYAFSNVVADDFLNEGSESYRLSVTSVSDDNNFFEALVATPVGGVTGTINDEAIADEALISIRAEQTISEGDLSSNFFLTLDQAARDVTSDILVNLVYSGVAQDGVDFSGISQVTIKAGTNSQNFIIATINDSIIEGSEEFTITIDSIVDANFEAIAANPSAERVTNTIVDDVDANPETVTLKEGSNLINTPNLLVNDEVGVNAQVIGFTYLDETQTLQNGTIGVQADTLYGLITLNADGSWVYISDAHEEHPSDGNTQDALLRDVITYNIKDDNNNSSSSTLNIDVGDTIATITPQTTQSVDEDDLASGSDTTPESLSLFGVALGINVNQDPIDNVFFDLTKIQTSLGSLTSDGQSLAYSLSNASHTLSAYDHNSNLIFTIILNSDNGDYNENSSYSFVLNGVLDHALSGEDILNLDIPFSVQELGADEDVIDGSISIDVVDDVPTAVVDSAMSVVEGGAQISANVLSNDTQGADGAELYDFTYKDSAGIMQTSTAFGVGVDTATGFLTVNVDGSWTFTPNTYVDHDDAIEGTTHVGDGSDNDSFEGNFSYRIVDGDGDISNSITQEINVIDGADPISSSVVNAVDEDDILGSGSDRNDSAQVSGNLSVTGGSDPIDVSFTTANSATLSSNGVAITYTLSNNGHTLIANAGSDLIFEAIITDPNVDNPSYTFELFGQLDHADANGENIQDVILEYKSLDIDGDSVVSNLVVSVRDDVPYIGTPADGIVDEAGLAYGSDTDITKTQTSGSLDVLIEADTIDTTFTADTITALEALAITAGSPQELLVYTISDNGHTLTATDSTKTIFEVNIVDFTSTNAAYEFTLVNSFHHDGQSEKTLTFNFTTQDYDGDTATSSFEIEVIDDSGVATKDITVNEDGTVLFGLTADSILATSDFITPHGEISFDSSTNLFTYTPDADYSSSDTFDITYTTSSGDTTTTVNATINPISDASDTALTSTSLSTDEDTLVALGLIAPVVKDDFDQNDIVPSSHDVAGDNPEKLGAITLSGLPSGAELHVGSTVILLSGSAITIQISDLDENGDGENDHLSGLTTDYTMTQAEFESLYILPPLNSGDNIYATYSVSSYEVDDSGLKLLGVSGKTSSTNFTVDVHAITDDGLALSVADVSGDEDNWIRIDDAITITPTLDVDGSEKYEVVFDAASLPSGTLFYEGTPADISDRSIGSDASGGFTIVVSDPTNIPSIYIMTPVNDSNDITNLKVTVNVQDTDSDSTPASDSVKSVSDYIDVSVTPLANDIVVSSSGASGDEDTKIALNLLFTNSDTPLEKVISVTISDIPDGAQIYDASGQLVFSNSSGTLSSFTIQTPTGDLSEIEAYTILPPAHSSSDITLQVSMELKDFDDDGSSNTDTQTTADVAVFVEVLAVSENDSTDTATPAGTDISYNESHYYSTNAEEDTYFNLNSADSNFNLFTINEDDASISPYGSEETFVVFTNLRGVDSNFNTTSLDDAYIKYNDGTQDIELKFSANEEVKVPLEFLDTVEIKAPSDFAGTFIVDMYVQSQDFDEDSSNAATIESSQSVMLVIDVNPVIDINPNVNINQSIGVEDDGRIADGRINATSAANGILINATISSLDTDGSEKFRVFLDDIPIDAALYYKGHIIYANSADDFLADGIKITDNGDGTYKAQLEDYSTSIAPKIIPEHNSDTDITLKVSSQTVDSATLVDGSVVEVEGPLSAEQDVVINIAARADQVMFTEMKSFDISEDSSITTGNRFTTDEKIDGSGVYTLIVEEDSKSSGIGAEILISELFIATNSIDSYDNIFSNALDTSPVFDSSEASENVTITITNLDAAFNVSGATLVNGVDSSRVWSFTLAELKAGNVSVTTDEHFSGEVDFDIKFISTEITGNVKEGTTQSVKVLVTPVAEDITGEILKPLNISEDVLTSTYVQFGVNLPDDNGNSELIYEEWIKVSDVTNKDFKLFYDDGSSQYNEISTVVSPDITIVSIGGEDYYHLQNYSFQHLFFQYDSDLGPVPSVDKDIDVKVTLIDYIDINGETISNISDRVDLVYSMNLIAVTDDIDAKVLSASDVTYSDNPAYANDEVTNIVVDTNGNVSMDIMTNTQVSININIDGVDTAGEVDTDNPSDTTNGSDYDGSEEIVQIRLEGVAKGVDIQDGYYVGDITGTDTGIWHINAPKDSDGGVLSIDGTADYNLVLLINGDGIDSGDHNIDSVITVSFINQDGSGANTQSDSITISLDDSNFTQNPNIEIPMDILEWSVGTQDIFVEDVATILGDIVSFSIDTATVGVNAGSTYNGISGIADGSAVTSNRFSLTVEGLENCSVSGAGWSLDNYGATPFYTYEGVGGASAIQAALDALEIVPNQDYNENHDTNVGDTLSAFDEGPLEFNATLTTYGDGGFRDVQSLSYSGDVTPVTDDLAHNGVFVFTDESGGTSTEALEDGSVAISVTISSVDDPYLTVVDTDVTVTNVSSDNVGVIVADGSDETLNGSIWWTSSGGWIDLDVGSSVDIPIAEIDSVKFKLDQYIAGDVSLEYSANVQEQGTAMETTQKGTISFYVNPVADGLNITNAKIDGFEDTYIELTSSSGDSFDALGALVDPTEELSSLVIEGIPNGYLVFYGDNHQNSASVIDVDARGLVSFNIPVSGTSPKIWILPPANVGGVTSSPSPDWELLNSITLKIGVDDMGVTVFDSKSVSVNIIAVADEVTIAPSNTSGEEGSEIALNFNTTVIDTDKSERLIITLNGLGENAVFILDGVEIDQGYITYEYPSDTYTIDHESINYTNISKLSFIQNNFSGTVTTTVVSQENSSGDRYATPASVTFSVIVTEQNASSSDDILLFDKINGNDGLDGDDTLVFGYNWAQESIDFTLYDDTLTKNIEVLDLTEHGDHTVNISSTDLEAMSDTTNDLIINADSGDAIALMNSTTDTDDVWAQVGSTDVYETAQGGSLSINGGIIGDTITHATFLDDVLGYNGSNDINAELGDDRLIIFDGVEVDFSKVHHIETIDFEVVGNHTITDLTLSEVISVTDHNNSLTIFGDNGDSVDFDSNDNWVKNDLTNAYSGQTVSEDGRTFDVYTSSSDISVEVKVQVEVQDSI